MSNPRIEKHICNSKAPGRMVARCGYNEIEAYGNFYYDYEWKKAKNDRTFASLQGVWDMPSCRICFKPEKELTFDETIKI